MLKLSKGKNYIISWIDEHCESFYPYADAIWSYAELGCQEVLSSSLLIELLQKHDFYVKKGIAGMPTAFIAEWGDGEPVIGFNCEYDALPGLSQQSGIEKHPVVEGAPGHGCGHNLLGVGSVMAAIAITRWISTAKLSGTVKVLGTPAEEICVGKAYLGRDGFFQGIDAIFDWHPWFHTNANYDTCNAYFNLKYHFRGCTAHGNAPWEGKSALDGALLMGQALEMLREHIPPGNPNASNTFNYTFSDVGPEYPNVVPDRSTLWVTGRITTSKEMKGVIERIHRCAEGAALASGTTLKKEFVTATHEKIPNKTLAALLHRNLTEIGPPQFSSGEQEVAKKIQRTFGIEEEGLSEQIMPYAGGTSVVSDNSEYSWFAPFAMVWITTTPANIGWHNWQVAALAIDTIGKKAMVSASKVLALSADELLEEPRIIEEAKKEWSERLAGKQYRCLIPEGVTPPIDINRQTMEKYRSLMEKHYRHLKKFETTY